MNFKISKKSTKSRARIGFLETSHGIVETPCLVPCATQAVVKTLESEEVVKTKTQLLIANTFWLHLLPGEKIIEKSGKLHNFMNWKKPLMTDSAGFQVFSLGFGHDFGLTKFSLGNQNFSAASPLLQGSLSRKNLLPRSINAGSQPKSVKITPEGVYFKSPINGDELFIGPKESIKIQEKLGADIMFAFDECTPPLADKRYVENSLEKTHRWAKICLKTRKTKQALYGIVQGSEFKDLRQASASYINSLDFDGFGIGGDLWRDKEGTNRVLDWVIPLLNEKKPRHMLGVGYLKNIEDIIKSGIDTFDCTVPTHYARRGIAFTSEGRLDLNKAKFLKKNEPLDKGCVCNVCLNYKKNYIAHLLKAKEITALRLLTSHNLWYFNTFVEEIKIKIKKGEI